MPFLHQRHKKRTNVSIRSTPSLACTWNRARKPVPPFGRACASLPPAPTVQAAVVVLPVRAHGVLFAYKHHFGHAHLDETSTLQGSAHAEQLLQTNRPPRGESLQCHSRETVEAWWDRRGALTTMSSSVTRGCRLFTVIFVPSRGLTTGWRKIKLFFVTPTDSS